ncbi:MAG: sulfurtransferase TusA family protein [Spirochaetota bacterium]
MEKHTLDITKDHCPMTFVKTKLELEKLNTGDQLEIYLTEGEPLENVPRTAKEQGYTVVETVRLDNHIYRVVIEK